MLWFSVFSGGNQDHRQDATRRVQPAEGVPGGEDPQNAQTPTHYQTIPGKHLIFNFLIFKIVWRA